MLDETAKNFLGVTDEKDVKELRGQKADAQKVADVQKDLLLHEACNFGDALVRYVINHLKLSNEQRAWATTLGILCLRSDYPNGEATFDELSDQGGDDLELETINYDAFENIQKDALADESVFSEAAKFAELFAKYTAQLKNTFGISNPQVCYGIGRAFHNLRLTFPHESGGPAGFDHWASEAGAYFRSAR